MGALLVKDGAQCALGEFLLPARFSKCRACSGLVMPRIRALCGGDRGWLACCLGAERAPSVHSGEGGVGVFVCIDVLGVESCADAGRRTRTVRCDYVL